MNPKIDIYITDEQATRLLHADARTGLTSTPKWLSPKWRWDAAGSQIFERITKTPAYYPFRLERDLLADHRAEIVELADVNTIVELGSGSSEKTRLLLDQYLAQSAGLRTFVPIDVSRSALEETIAALGAEYPTLSVRGVVADFNLHMRQIGTDGMGRTLLLFLGGTIGNVLPKERARFLSSLWDFLGPGDLLLVGAGLVAPAQVIEAAYDDADGVAASFNYNVLHRLNRELGADFDVSGFEHRAVWNQAHERIEGFLRARRSMQVRVADLGVTLDFACGELFRTDVSGKFRVEPFVAELTESGFPVERVWTDPDNLYMLTLATRSRK